MSDDVIIEQMRLADRDALIRFLAQAYEDSPRQSDVEMWNWHFVTAPNSSEADIPVWLARSGDAIAGQLGAISVELNVDGVARRAIWILDLIVDPSFRRRGIAQRLVGAARGYCPYMLGVNTNEQHAPAMLQKLGWKIVTPIPRFFRLLYPGHVLPELRRARATRAISNAAFAPFRSHRVTASGMYRVETLQSFDDRFDVLWRKVRRQWPCVVSRDSAMLNWQFNEQPDKEYEVVGCVDAAGSLVGYAVMFFRKAGAEGVVDKAAISDILYVAEDGETVLDALIGACVEMALVRKVGGIVADATDDRLIAGLKRGGFRRTRSPLQLMVHVPESPSPVYDAENWYITRGDADISIFEHPNV